MHWRAIDSDVSRALEGEAALPEELLLPIFLSACNADERGGIEKNGLEEELGGTGRLRAILNVYWDDLDWPWQESEGFYGPGPSMY